MMATPKPSASGLPGSIAIHLPAYKRKRIEQWCEDLAQYLKAGSLCRSVLGHSPEDGRLLGATAVKSAPAGSHQRTNHTTPAISTPSAAITTNTPPVAAITTTSMGTVTEMLSLSHNKNAGSGLNGVKMDSAPPPGRGTPMPDTTGPLPVVKFSYGHYNEQRRRVDRLVQGLPVLSSSNTPSSAVDRLGGNSGAVVFVSGEEPVKSAKFGTAGSKADRAGRASPAPGPAPRSNSRSSSGEPRQRPLPAHLPRHQSVSPSPTRNHPHLTTSLSHPLGGPQQGSNKMQSSEIVVIEDEFPGQSRQSDALATSGLRSMRLNGLKRSQSQKVQKARQRMLAGTRRSGDQNTHTHVPVQSCWALAELTW